MYSILLIGLLLFQGQQQLSSTAQSGGAVSGRLSYDDGTPVTRTILRAQTVASPGQPADNPAPGAMAITDEAGAFQWKNLPPGRYVISAASDGLAAYYPGTTTRSDATTLTVTTGSVTEGLTFLLPRAFSGVRVSGRVIRPPNQAAPVTQRVKMNVGFGGPESVIAPDGTFEILHVRAGNYSIIVDPAPGAQPLIIGVAEVDITGIELIVPRLINVTGSVALEGGGARPGFTLALTGAYRTVVDVPPSGVFTARLPAGDYRLAISGLPAGIYLKSLAADSTNLLTDPLKIAAQDTASNIALTLGTSSAVAVRGRVTSPGAASTPVPIKVTLTGTAVSETAEAAVDAGGSFEFARVVPGTYSARVSTTSTISAPPVPVVVPARDLSDLEIVVPPSREVIGRVAVEEGGPLPKFALMLIRGPGIDLYRNDPVAIPALSTADANALALTAGTAGSQIISLSVNPLPDGTFRVTLPEGEYQIALGPPRPNSGNPPAYFMKSLTYGSANLFRERLKISGPESAEIQVGFGTTATNPWVKVSGKVTGVDRSQGPARVALESSALATMEAPVNVADGTFEFPRVLRRSNYTARLLPANPAASSPGIFVADRDVTGVEIAAPREKEVAGKATLSRDGPVPNFALSLSGSASGVTVLVRPEQDGTFRIKLPDDERRVSVNGLPLGFDVKSLTYGDLDLLKQSLKLSEMSPAEIRVTFSADPMVNFGSARGRVTGLDPAGDKFRIVLTGVTSVSTFEETLNPDGSFFVGRIPQGTYAVSLAGDGSRAVTVSPASIVVSGVISGNDPGRIELKATRQRVNQDRPSTDNTPIGATISELGSLAGPERSAANEAAAIASLRTITTALVTYLRPSGGKYGDMQNLISAGLIDSRFNGVVSGFSFSIVTIGQNYAATAVPASPETGRYGFYSSPDGVVRYSLADVLTPPGQNGLPVVR